MLRILLLAAAVVLLLWLLTRPRRRVEPPARPAKPGRIERETIVACAHCGVHLPRGEAVEGAGALYCGEAHRLEHEQRER